MSKPITVLVLYIVTLVIAFVVARVFSLDEVRFIANTALFLGIAANVRIKK